MFRLVEFSKQGRAVLQPGMLKEKDAENLTDNQMMVSDPDVNYFATILNSVEEDFYSTSITIQNVLEERASIEPIKNVRHYFLLGDRYEVVAKLSKSEKFFKLTEVMGTITVLIKKIRIGEPFDDEPKQPKKKKRKK
jgi:hypothetical protein